MTHRGKINVSQKIYGRNLWFLLLLGDLVLINVTGNLVVSFFDFYMLIHWCMDNLN